MISASALAILGFPSLLSLEREFNSRKARGSARLIIRPGRDVLGMPRTPRANRMRRDRTRGMHLQQLTTASRSLAHRDIDSSSSLGRGRVNAGALCAICEMNRA